jgi:hypothetical protein
LFARDQIVEGLELEPAGFAAPNLFACCQGRFAIDEHGLARGFGKELSVTAAIHSDEPPGRFIYSLADGQQAVIAKDDGFVMAKGLGDALAFTGFVNDTCEIRKDGVVFEEGAGVLGDRVEWAAKGCPGLAMQRVRMSGSNDIGTRMVNARVNRESRDVDRIIALDNFALGIHQDQVGSADMPKVDSEGIDPEMIGPLGISSGDVSGDTFVVTKFSEQAKGGGEALLSVAAFLFWSRKFRWGGKLEDGCRRSTHVNHLAG